MKATHASSPASTLRRERTVRPPVAGVVSVLGVLTFAPAVRRHRRRRRDAHDRRPEPGRLPRRDLPARPGLLRRHRQRPDPRLHHVPLRPAAAASRASSSGRSTDATEATCRPRFGLASSAERDSRSGCACSLGWRKRSAPTFSHGTTTAFAEAAASDVASEYPAKGRNRREAPSCRWAKRRLGCLRSYALAPSNAHPGQHEQRHNDDHGNDDRPHARRLAHPCPGTATCIGPGRAADARSGRTEQRASRRRCAPFRRSGHSHDGFVLALKGSAGIVGGPTTTRRVEGRSPALMFCNLLLDSCFDLLPRSSAVVVSQHGVSQFRKVFRVERQVPRTDEVPQDTRASFHLLRRRLHSRSSHAELQSQTRQATARPLARVPRSSGSGRRGHRSPRLPRIPA